MPVFAAPHYPRSGAGYKVLKHKQLDCNNKNNLDDDDDDDNDNDNENKIFSHLIKDYVYLDSDKVYM